LERKIGDEWAEMARGKKTGGRAFKPGRNSHSNEPHRRGPDRIPRTSVRLFYRVFLAENRERLWNALVKAADDPKLAMVLLENIGNRVEGRPVQHHNIQAPRTTIFARDMTQTTPVQKPMNDENDAVGKSSPADKDLARPDSGAFIVV
jgi:hypothetical protein